jgi:hypothetical protein
MRWAQRQRLDYIHRRMKAPGWIRRINIEGQYEVSDTTASGDLQAYLSLYPGEMIYCTGRKRYESMSLFRRLNAAQEKLDAIVKTDVDL